MNSFFKYTHSKYINAMLNNGQIRIGTLYEYREYENLEIGDVDEGYVKLFTHVDDLVVKDGDKLPGAFNHDLSDSLPTGTPAEYRYPFNVSGGGSMHLQNVTVVIKSTLPDVYMYCLTTEPSEQKMKEFGYDTCIEVLDINNFVSSIAIELQKQGYGNGMATGNPCVYVKKEYDYENPRQLTHFMKEDNYSDQKEFRLIFYPSDFPTIGKPADYQEIRPDISPVIINVPDIANNIRLYDFN
jgi:hypothetical protein